MAAHAPELAVPPEARDPDRPTAALDVAVDRVVVRVRVGRVDARALRTHQSKTRYRYAQWNRMEWNGAHCNGMEWNETEWNGMERNGMKWIVPATRAARS